MGKEGKGGIGEMVGLKREGPVTGILGVAGERSETIIAGMGGVGEPVGKSLELKLTERSLVVMATLRAETCWLTSRHGGCQPTAASLQVRGPNIAPLYARWSDSESMSMGVVETRSLRACKRERVVAQQAPARMLSLCHRKIKDAG